MSSSPTETLTPVLMPQMGISVSEGTVIEWRVVVGDSVEADQTLCDVTTDKVDVEIPSPCSGVVETLLVDAGESAAVGRPIAELRSGSAAGPVAGSTPAALPARESGPRKGHIPTPPVEETSRVGFVSPVVRRIADKHGIDLAEVDGTGVGGRIRKRDLLTVVDQPVERPLHSESPYVPEPAASNGARREPMSPMRKAIAAHMVRSRHTAAHCTTVVEVDFSAVAARRAKLKASYASRGVPLTYLAFVARATVMALEEFPVLNSSVEGDEVVFHDAVNLGLAVALDDGLIVPVIPDAQRLSLEGTAAAIDDAASRARAGKLAPDDVQGGTFTITNPGQFGAVLATPIINQPQVAILDLEAIVKRPVVVDDAIAIRPIGYLPLSWDHRALDGADAARFLGLVKQLLEAGDLA